MIKLNNEELENKIKQLYEEKLSKRKIAKQLLISTSYIDRILADNQFALNSKENLVAKCKVTGEIFEDYTNSSGILTRHILKLNSNFILPTGFKRRNVFKTTGKYWYEEQFFEIIQGDEKEIKPVKKCQYCDWTTFDIENKSGALTSHLKDAHNKPITQYLSEFPDDCILFKTFLNNISYQDEIYSSPDNYVVCVICNAKLSSLRNTHLKNHNLTLSEYKQLYPNVKYHSVRFIKNTGATLKEANKKAVRKYTSKPEIEIATFIRNFDSNIENPNRKLLEGVEIDIVSHLFKIGIEFNGLLYHSEKYGNKKWDYHNNKTILMNDKGYVLIHIFEDEWAYKQDIIKSKLMHLFDKTPNKIHARLCTISKITNQIKGNFLDENHLLGNDNSDLSYGAFNGNDLIAIMTFDSKTNMVNRINDFNTYELKRFAIKLYHSSTGIANRLLKFFIKDMCPKKIITFAEKTWTNYETKSLYTNLGFKCIGELRPDYKYFSRVKTGPKLHKFAFNKNALKKKYPEIYDDNKTEWEMMQELKYDRIWDCGKWKYELSLS